jgi:hypothetical protein
MNINETPTQAVDWTWFADFFTDEDETETDDNPASRDNLYYAP